MITVKQRKNGKKVISSDYFDQVKLYKDMMKDTFTELGTGAARYQRKFSEVAQAREVQLRAVVQQMIAARLGVAEVADYARQYKGDLNDIILNYGPAQPSDDYDDMKKELDELESISDKDKKQLERISELKGKINSFDVFVAHELEKCALGEDA